MPSLVKIKVERGRDLPIMDRNATTEAATDAYVEVRLDEQCQRTNTCRKSLNPIWNEDFRFEVIDDSILQDAPIELKCLDHDLYSSELIGIVYIDLNPLIMRTGDGTERDLFIRGWFPLYDTSRGIRGSLLITVKLQFIGNENQFRDSSAGVQFFSSSKLSPSCFLIQEILGFVEDLIVEDDPESSWQDYFRKGNKSSNDSRLKVLYNLNAIVRRELGKKVLELGGNAVLGFAVNFDIEGSSGIVARAYGTACRLLKLNEQSATIQLPTKYLSRVTTSSGDDWQLLLNNAGFLGKVQQDTAELFSTKLARAIGSGSNSTAAGDGIVLLKSVDANVCNATLLAPFGLQKEKPMKNRDMLSNSLFHSLTGNNRIANLDFNSLDVIGNGNADNHMFQTEIQLFTMKTFPENVKVKIGGLVVARSVKFLGKLEATLSDQETREGWWQELRDEIRSHAKVLCCKHIIGYSETCSIFNDVCILSAFGTAAVLKGLSYPSAFLTPAGGDDPSSPKRSRTSSEAVGDENTSILDGHEAPRRMRTGSSDSIEERSSRKGSKADIPSKVSLNRSSSYQSIIRNPLPVKRQTTTPQTIDELAIADNAVSNNSVINWPPTANATGYQQNSANSTKKRSITRPCAFTHVPYNHNTAPFSFMRLIPCQSCKRKWVPETILTTTEPPNNVNVKGHAQLLEARVCRSRRAGSGENDAVKISDVLPFAEFDLQRQIILKLKILGMNAAFGYSCRLQVGNDMVIATASCTAVFLKSLPAPPSLQIGRVREGRTEQDLRLARLQKEIDDLSQYNKMLLEKSSKSVRSSSRQRDNTYGSPTSRSRIMQNGDGQKGGRLSDGIAKTDYFISEALPHGFTNSSNSYRFGSIGEDEEKSLTLSSSTESSLSSSESSENEDSSLESPSSSSSSEESEEDSDEEEYLAHEKDSNDVHKLEKELDNANLTASASRDTEGKNKDILVVPKRNRHRSNSYEDLETARQGQASGKTPGKATKKKEKRMVYKDERPPFMLEVDDETDADIMAVLSDWWLPSKLDIVNVGFVPGAEEAPCDLGRNITILRRRKLVQRAQGSLSHAKFSSGSGMNTSQSVGGNADVNSFAGPKVILAMTNGRIQPADFGSGLSHLFGELFQEAYLRMCYAVKKLLPCQILGLVHHVNVLDDDVVEVILSGMAHKVQRAPRAKYLLYHDSFQNTGGILDGDMSGHATPKRHRSPRNSVRGETTNDAERVIDDVFGSGLHGIRDRSSTISSTRSQSFDNGFDSDLASRIVTQRPLTAPIGAPVLLYPAAENVSSASTATSVHTIIPLVAPAARTESVSSLESGISPSQLIQQIEECKKPDTTAEISGLDRVFTEAGTLPPPIPIAISETPRSHSPSTILGISKAPNLASSSGDEQSIATSIIGSKVGGPVILADEEMAVVRRNENLIDLEEGLSASAVAAAAASFVLESFKPSDSNEIKLMDSRLYQRKDSTGSLYLNTTPPNLGASPSSNTLSPRAYSETYSNFKAATSYNTLTGDSTGNIADVTSTNNHSTVMYSSQQVLITSLSEVPVSRVKRYLGPIQLHFIKDAYSARGEDNLGSFFHLFASEANATARAQVAALGGNALVCHKLIPQESSGRVSRNQAYSMLTVTGDAVLLDFAVDHDQIPQQLLTPIPAIDNSIPNF